MIPGYYLDVLLESGVRGENYLAHHTASGQSCVVKILPADPESYQQFLDEAKLAATLFHPNVVDIYEAGTLTSGELYVVTEDADGQTLSERLKTGPAPELLTSIEIVRQTAEALHAIHLKGLAHRAVNTENILLTIDSENRLLVRIREIDFGGSNERAIVSNKFLIDSALNALKYFSPEQCLGEPVGTRTDIYSLGIVLYEMLAGAPPFDATKASGLIEKHRSQRPPDIRINDFELRMLVTHTLTESLNKRPEKRQSTADAFARQLRHIEQLATHVSTPPPAGAVPREPRRSTARVNIAPVSVSSTIIEPAPVSASLPYDLNAIPDVILDEPVVDLKLEMTPPPRSRLKLWRKKLRQLSVPSLIDTLQSAPVSSVETVPVRIEPTRIEWDQPEDDIPSLTEVMEVLTIEPIMEVPVVLQESQVMKAVQETPKKVVSIPDRPKPVPVAQAAPEKIAAIPQTRKTIVSEPEEPEEITVVTPRSAPVRIYVEQPAIHRHAAPAHNIFSNTSRGSTFFPTILGDVDARETADLDMSGSILSSYSASIRKRSSIPYRSMMIGGGVLGLIALFLFGGDSILRFVSTGSSGDTVAAKTSSSKDSLPSVAHANTASPSKKKLAKYFEPARSENDDADADRSKPTLTNERTPAQKSAKTSSGSPARSTSPDNGKTRSIIGAEKRVGEKQTIIISNKPSEFTRPRVVKITKP